MSDPPFGRPTHGPGGTVDDEAGDRAEEIRLQRAANIAINKAMSRLDWLGAKSGSLQFPSSGDRSCFVQDFQNGSVWAIEYATNAFAVRDFIKTRFDQIGGGIGILGCPITDQTEARDFVPSHTTPNGHHVPHRGGTFNNFENGSIYHLQLAGTWEIYGDIGAKWHSLNAEMGFLGYPTSAESSIGPGRVQTFQHGQIFWTSAAEACVLPQALMEKFNQLGGPLGTLGFPITNELPLSDRAGTMIRFQKGKLTWTSPDPATVFVSMDSVYKFSVDKIQCVTTRSRSTDTLHIALSVAALGRDPISVAKSLGDHAQGFVFPDISIPGIYISDEEIPLFAYMLMNNGNADAGAVINGLSEGVKTIAQGGATVAGTAAGEAVGGAVGKGFLSGAETAVGAWIGMITGTPVPVLGPIVGAALGAIAGWAVGQLIDLANPNCDGLVAASAIPVG